MKVKDFFSNQLASKLSLNPALLVAAGVKNQSVGLDIEGEEGGRWLFSFNSQGELAMLANADTNQVDCFIQMKDSVFAGLMDGKVNVALAVITRKIKIKGDLALAERVGRALRDAYRNA